MQNLIIMLPLYVRLMSNSYNAVVELCAAQTIVIYVIFNDSMSQTLNVPNSAQMQCKVITRSTLKRDQSDFDPASRLKRTNYRSSLAVIWRRRMMHLTLTYAVHSDYPNKHQAYLNPCSTSVSRNMLRARDIPMITTIDTSVLRHNIMMHLRITHTNGHFNFNSLAIRLSRHSLRL